jgi:O-succinylbenzoic acid--CoA ligase
MRVVRVDGGEAAVRALSEALDDALRGGPPVLPAAPGAEAVVAAMRPDDPVPEPTAVLVASSGSTGNPKGVLLSASALTSSARATHVRLGGQGRWLLATPAQYIGGLQVLVRSLLSGLEPGVLDLTRGFRPAEFVAAAQPVLAASGPHYTALVPTQLLRLLDTGGSALEAAQGFDAIVIGGAALPPEVRERARDAGVRVVRAYGMTETCGGCVYDGLPLDGVRVRIGPADRVELAGDVLALGYRHGELGLHDGWLRTDDVGRLRDDGRLEVLGRADDVINSGGVKVPAPAVEQALRGHAGVRAACVVGLPDAEWGEVVAALVVPVDAQQPPSIDDLAAAVRASAGRAAAPKVVRFVDDLPLRGPGKVDRAAVKALLLRSSEPFTS